MIKISLCAIEMNLPLLCSYAVVIVCSTLLVGGLRTWGELRVVMLVSIVVMILSTVKIKRAA
jgi:hypothetical protein